MTSFAEKADNLIWNSNLQPMPVPVAWLVRGARLLLAVARDLREGFLSLRATSLVYTTLLALAPLLAISFAVLKGFGVHNQIEPFLKSFLRPLGVQGDDLVERIVQFVDNIQVGVLGALGVALLIYSVLALMHKIEIAFNQIWNVPSARSLGLRIRDYLGVLMTGPLFIFLSVGITTSLQHADILQAFFNIDVVSYAFDMTFRVIPYILFALAFTAIYMFLPNTRVRFLPAFAAGVITGLLWKVLGWLFGVFVAQSASYAAIYSAFAALILFIFWLYVGWLVVLAGASFAYYLQYPSNQRYSRRVRHLSLRVKEKLALLILAEIGRGFYAKEEPQTQDDLARRLRLPMMAVSDVIEDLAAADLVATVGKRQQQFIPGRPFDTTSVHDMMTLLRQQDEKDSVSFSQLKSTPAADRVMELGEKASGVVFGGITLKQIALGDLKQ